MNKIEAPWTAQQVLALNHWQHRGDVHPFTCGNRDDHPPDNGERGRLLATENGWVCPLCDYTQTWAFAEMAVWPPAHHGEL
jgi:hypothetical protein